MKVPAGPATNEILRDGGQANQKRVTQQGRNSNVIQQVLCHPPTKQAGIVPQAFFGLAAFFQRTDAVRCGDMVHQCGAWAVAVGARAGRSELQEQVTYNSRTQWLDFSMDSIPSTNERLAAMPEISRIMAAAAARALASGLPYAGALTPQEAHALLQALPEARLIDVRTRAEWHWVGRVPQALEIEWQNWPGGERNPHFLDALQGLVLPDAPLLFLCRSGVRSHHAAALASSHGFSACFNVLEGFEGDKDAHGQRGTLGGWRQAGLPWQS